MRIETKIRESEKLIQWLDSKIDGLDIPSSERFRLAAGCLDTALEHQKSIVLLTANSLYGSAAALVRLIFESYVRGVWLLKSATEGDIQSFKKDKLKKSICELIEDLEKHEAFKGGTLSHVKETSWNTMNSFTHSGFYQVVRRNTQDSITSNYSDMELVDALETANSFGILTAIAVADMARNNNLALEVFERGNEFFNNEQK